MPRRLHHTLPWVLLLCLCAALPAVPPAAAASEGDDGSACRETLLLRVTITDPDTQIPLLVRMDLDIAGINRKASTVDVIGDRSTLDDLVIEGFTVGIAEDLSTTDETIAALDDYLNPEEISAKLDYYQSTYPALAKKIQYATTEEGRPVWAMKISDNVDQEEDEPAILYVAQHHAREVMTPEVAMDIVDYLLTGYGTDAQVTDWVDNREIWVLPSHNPDGTNYVFTADNMWRKNRRDNGDGNFGVDLNRNYPFKWGACNGSSGSTSSSTYRGPSPASEPETQGIMDLARQQRPVINLSYHSTGELVLHPYGCDGSHPPELAAFRDLSSDMATRLTSDDGQHWYEPGTGWELLYAVDGEMNDWFYGELGSYGTTIEVNAGAQGFQPDYDTWRDSTVERNRPGWMYLLDRVDGPSVRGHVTDACTGDPLEATISFDEFLFINDETPRTSEPVHGRFQWLTTPGAYTLRVNLDGYHEQVWPTDVDLAPADREVRLVPLGSYDLAVYELVVDDSSPDADGDGQPDPGEQFQLTVRLLNTGDDLTGVVATLSSDDPNVTIQDDTSSYASMTAGAVADGDTFTLSLAPGTPDEHEVLLHLAFSADQALCTAGEDATLRATTGFPGCPTAGDNLDTDPGWTIENNGTGGWEFGPPLGNGGSTGPASAPTGENVYGTNLSGDYGNNGDFLLTTGSYDLRGVRHAELRYQEWLHNEAGFDIASTEISVDGGQTWTEVWSGFGYGDGWRERRIDISSVADREQDVRFRFRLRSDANTTHPGFYLDDVWVCGEEIPNASGKIQYADHVTDETDPDYGNGNGTVDVGETAVLQVKVRSNRDTVSTGVDAFLTTTTPGVTVRTGYAAFPDIAVGGTAWSLAPHFTFTVDDASCGTEIAFTLDVRWDGGRSLSTFTVPVGHPVTAVVLDDDFETDQGWITGGDATAGFWVRDDPYEVNDALGNPVQPEDDTTPDPGVLCWITDNPRPKGNFQPGDGDVDGGTVWIESPTFDGGGATRLDLTMNRWFVRRNPGQFDTSNFRILASADDGGTWAEVSFLDTDSPFWATTTHDLTESLDPSPTMRVRVEVTEDVGMIGGDTLVEGLVDDVQIERERLECDPYNPPAHQPPNPVGNTLVLAKDGSNLRMDWQPPSADPTHDTATSYRVYRSNAPDAGFTVESKPTAAFDVWADELSDPRNGHFLIVAENSGGTSGDEPAP